MAHRKGFTLVELMVSLALTVFMMAILSEAFVVGLESFRKLRAMAELEQGMRTVEAILRSDLAADHFEGAKRLSECTVSGQRMPTFPPLDPNNNPTVVTAQTLAPYRFAPPALGFFSIREGVYLDGAGKPWPQCPNYSLTLAPNGTCEYEFADTLGTGKFSWRDTNDSLHFTVRLNGNKRETFFSGHVSPGSALDVNAGSMDSRFQTAGAATFESQWAEVVYFLAPGEFRPPGQPQLFNLYRRQLLLLPDAFTVGNGLASIMQVPRATNGGPPNSTNYVGGSGVPATDLPQYYRQYDVSAFYDYRNTNNFWFNTPADVQFRQRRYGNDPGSGVPLPNSLYQSPPFSRWQYPRLQDLLGGADARAGADLLLANVISFDVKVLDPIPTTSTDNFHPNSGYGQVLYPPPVGSQPLPFGLLGPNRNDVPNPLTSLAIVANNPNRFVDIGFGRNYTDGNNDSIGNQGPLVGPGSTLVPGPGIPRAVDYTGGYVFDSWSTRNNGSWNYAATPPPYLYPFSAIQIKVRAWDRKTNQTRELTIVQDM